jgi:formylglycine-generating enzyme required for sulfatase activity
MKKILLFILLFPFQLLIAQNEMRVVGNGEFQPSELIDKSIRDANGEVCAGLMIVTDLTGMRYDSYNGIVKVNQNPGKDFLFLSPDERVVEIFCPGFVSLKIILSDYGIALKKGEVWKLKITGDKVSDLIPINIVVKPTDAQVYIDDKLQVNNAIQVSAGSHKIKIIKEGYQTIEENINVAVGKTLFNYTLSEVELAKVQISSSPQGAKIFINSLEKGETNKGLFLYPGVYLLKLSKSGYLDKEEKITVGSNKQNNFTYNLEKNAGSLNITVTPNSATVLINKEKFTQKNIELPPGKYKIEISENGYYDQNETIEMELGKTINKSFNLQPKVGKLQFSVSPIEADVTLSKNGKVVKSWQGLELLKDLQVGEYEITAKSNGYISQTTKIVINEEKTTVEDITLKQSNNGNNNYLGGTTSGLNSDNMIYVEGGTFMMGSNEGEADEKPVHSVTVNSFYISKYEVTQKEWINIMGSNPSYFKGDNLPVERVSWNDVQEFIKKLNQKTGQKYRLPTEAEWEYAARGGNKSNGYKYSGSNNKDEVAWYYNNSNSKTHEVGTKAPNELGIYDMTGNVWEWCSDWYDENYYKNSPSNNPKGPNSGDYRVLRGGSWSALDLGCRSVDRYWIIPGSWGNVVGFRLVQD